MKKDISQKLLSLAAWCVEILVMGIALLNVIILLVLAGAGVLVTSMSFLFAHLIIELGDMALLYTQALKNGKNSTERRRHF